MSKLASLFFPSLREKAAQITKTLSEATARAQGELSPELQQAQQTLALAVRDNPEQVEMAAQAYMSLMNPAPGEQFFKKFNLLRIQIRDQTERTYTSAADFDTPVLSESVRNALLKAYDTQHPEASAVARAHFERILAVGPALSWREAFNLDENVKVEAQIAQRPKGPGTPRRAP